MGNRHFVAEDEYESWENAHRSAAVPPKLFRRRRDSSTLTAMMPASTDRREVAALPRYREVHPPRSSPHLLNLAWSRDWPALARRLETHPREAFDIGSWGRTALHLVFFPGAALFPDNNSNNGAGTGAGDACRTPPPRLVQLLLSVNPHAAVKMDNGGMAPLHYLCRFATTSFVATTTATDVPGEGAATVVDDGDSDKSEKAINDCARILCRTAIRIERELGSSPQPASPICGVPSPLELACDRRASPVLVRALLESLNKTEEVRTSGGEDRSSSAGSWIVPWTGAEPWWQCDVREYRPSSSSSSPLRTLWSRRICDQCGGEGGASERQLRWEVTRLLLEFEHRRGGEGDEDNAFRPLHAAAALAVPLPQVVEYAIGMHIGDVAVRDRRGFLPLHHSLLSRGAAIERRRRRLLDRSPLSFPDDEYEENRAYDDQMRQGARDVLRLLLASLQSLPPADRNDSRGRTPLALAVMTGWEWDEGLSDVVKSDPAALLVLDRTTGLVPFLHAATVVDDSGTSASLGTVYSLLRACPALESLRT